MLLKKQVPSSRRSQGLEYHSDCFCKSTRSHIPERAMWPYRGSECGCHNVGNSDGHSTTIYVPKR